VWGYLVFAEKQKTEVVIGKGLSAGMVPVSLFPRAIQKFLRRFRRYFMLPLAAIALLWLRPLLPGGNPFFDDLIDGVGVLIALLGQLLRFWVWGSNAPRGAAGVRTRGPYALVRHPLYVGNFLIACGLLVIFNNPWSYLLCGLPLALLYHAIVGLEEERMLKQFEGEYWQYIRSGVPRFFPAIRTLPTALRTSQPFHWRFAVKKEYESLLGWVAGALVLRMYERVLWQGVDVAWREVVILTVLLWATGILALTLYIYKIRNSER
jgi:protein-S-isoprenylcysteine O-methyltransferase Ste14